MLVLGWPSSRYPNHFRRGINRIVEVAQWTCARVARRQRWTLRGRFLMFLFFGFGLYMRKKRLAIGQVTIRGMIA